MKFYLVPHRCELREVYFQAHFMLSYCLSKNLTAGFFLLLELNFFLPLFDVKCYESSNLNFLAVRK